MKIQRYLIIINIHNLEIALYSKIHLCLLSPLNVVILKENAILQIDLFLTILDKQTLDRGRRCGILMDIMDMI